MQFLHCEIQFCFKKPKCTLTALHRAAAVTEQRDNQYLSLTEDSKAARARPSSHPNNTISLLSPVKTWANISDSCRHVWVLPKGEVPTYWQHELRQLDCKAHTVNINNSSTSNHIHILHKLTAFLRLLFLFMEANKAEPSSRRAPGTSYIKAEVSEVEARQQTNISEMPAGSTPSPRSRRAKHQDHRVRRAAREPNPFPSHKSPEQRATPRPHKQPF